MPADRLVPVPDGITDQQAAAMMLKGMTAWYLVRRTHPVKPGETILIHAAAGGVGLIVCQWAKHLGATVIGTVGDDEKAALAKTEWLRPPDHLHAARISSPRVNEITGGKKLPVVYDSVGKDTFYKSLDCLAPLGPDGVVRPVVGGDRPGRHRHPRRQGLAVPDPADAQHLHGEPRGSADRCPGAVRGRAEAAPSRSRSTRPIRCATPRRRTAT